MKLHHVSLWVLLLITLSAQAQHVDLSISQAELEAMHYRPQRLIEQSMEEFDRADCELGFRHLTEAAELAPEAITLQLELGRIAIELAESGDCDEEVTTFLSVARTAYQRALDNPNIPTWHRIRAERDLEQIPQLENENRDRLESRMESFQDYIQSSSVTTQLTGTNIAGPNLEGSWGSGGGSVINVTSMSQFDRMLNFDGPVLVDFCADWCGPCRAFEPVLRSYARQNTHVRVLSVDVDRNEDLSRRFDISGIPAVLLFRNGQLAGRSGSMPQASLERWVGR